MPESGLHILSLGTFFFFFEDKIFLPALVMPMGRSCEMAKAIMGLPFWVFVFGLFVGFDLRVLSLHSL